MITAGQQTDSSSENNDNKGMEKHGEQQMIMRQSKIGYDDSCKCQIDQSGRNNHQQRRVDFREEGSGDY